MMMMMMMMVMMMMMMMMMMTVHLASIRSNLAETWLSTAAASSSGIFLLGLTPARILMIMMIAIMIIITMIIMIIIAAMIAIMIIIANIIFIEPDAAAKLIPHTVGLAVDGHVC